MKKPIEFEKQFQFQDIEEKLYASWLPYTKIESQKTSSKKKERIFLMAPPNVTGSLHLGHALENSLIDVLVRFYRMRGERVIWIPGTDHAGIATQNVVEKKLRKEGKSRFELGKKQFNEEVWAWRKEYGNIILGQFKRLGIIPDWSRTKFTMDPEYVLSVQSAFIEYYKKGLIYRDYRAINYCTRCKTSLSDLELEWKNVSGKLYTLLYPLKDGGFISMATTRPETMLGDSAVAVNQKDERYGHLIGKTVLLPLVNREIPIVADRRVDPAFGTGAVKVTPAHSLVDFEISQRHKLPVIPVIDENGRIVGIEGFSGLNYKEAREKVLGELGKRNLLKNEETYEHSVPFCDRCKTEIQVIPSVEWFVSMKKLAQGAKQAVTTKKTRILPLRYKKPFMDWIAHIRDWCISRKLWWGQSIPVWYCASCMKQTDLPYSDDFVVSLKKPVRACTECKKKFWQPSEEVFDTWFSSALWPFATHYTAQEKKWYPAYLVSSAKEILHLWITRMIFSGLYFKNKKPFDVAFIHPVVLTKDGKRMSKSLGTGIDPLDLIEKSGADAVRFGLLWNMSEKQDIRFDESYIEAGRKFANKIWNATRFVCMRADEISAMQRMRSKASEKDTLPTQRKQSLADKKIIAQFNATKLRVEKHIQLFQFSDALKLLYEFFWHDFCDVYVESCKGDTTNDPKILMQVLEQSLKLIHPFMPFVTDALAQKLQKKHLPLFTQPWPTKL